MNLMNCSNIFLANIHRYTESVFGICTDTMATCVSRGSWIIKVMDLTSANLTDNQS